MKRARRHRRGLALLAALAVAFNALAGAFHARPVAASVLVDDVLGPLTICSPATAALPAHDKAPQHDDRRSDCPLCLRVSAPLLRDSPEIVLPEFAPPATLALSSERPPVVADHLSRGGIRSRAPPAAA